MEKLMNESSDLTTRTKINTVQLGLWTGAWVLTTAFAAFGPNSFGSSIPHLQFSEYSLIWGLDLE